MAENNKSNLDKFQEILEQQHKDAIKNVDEALLNDVLDTAKIVKENKDETNLKEIIGNLRERFKDKDLNQVTEIFIYCQSFLSTNEDPLPMPSTLCISIGKLFTNENLHYTASKVYGKDEIESGAALSFLGYLAMHEHHTHYIVNFIKENFSGFSNNKKTECVFQLKETLPDNDIAQQIIKDSGITEYRLTFSTGADSSSKPITFQINNIDNSPKTSVKESKSPWWKFGSKNK